MKELLRDWKRKWEGKKEIENSPAALLFAAFMVELVLCYFILQLSLIYVGHYYSPSDYEFMTQLKELDPSAYVGVAVLMIGYLKITKRMNMPIALAALFSVFMAVSSQLVSLIPADIDIPSGNDPGQTAIFGPVTLMLASMIGIAINLIWTIFQAAGQAESSKNSNQDPT